MVVVWCAWVGVGVTQPQQNTQKRVCVRRHKHTTMILQHASLQQLHMRCATWKQCCRLLSLGAFARQPQPRQLMCREGIATRAQAMGLIKRWARHAASRGQHTHAASWTTHGHSHSSCSAGMLQQHNTAMHLHALCRCEPESAPLNVAMLLSGGVDSSVAMTLLKAAGHNVTAFYLQIWFVEDFRNTWDSCPWEEDLDFCRKVRRRR